MAQYIDDERAAGGGQRATNAHVPTTCTPMRAVLLTFINVSPLWPRSGRNHEEQTMNAVASIAGYMKRHVLGQSLVRRNPFYYERSRGLLDNNESLDLAERRAWADAQLRSTLEGARHTDYGKSVQGTDEPKTWPLLEKENLRHGLKSFTTGNDWLSAPATTGGPVAYRSRCCVRSRPSCFERPHRHVHSSCALMHERADAVLRGDNPRDIVVSPTRRAKSSAAGASSR